MKEFHDVGLDGRNLQLFRSLYDYRELNDHPGGILVTSGPTETLVDNSYQLNKKNTEYGKKLFSFFGQNSGKEIVHEDGYDKILLDFYKILKHTDGASHFDNGYLTAVKRNIMLKDVSGIEDTEGGTRHMAAAYISKFPIVSYALSEETGNISVYMNGKRFMLDERKKKPSIHVVKNPLVAVELYPGFARI